MTADADPIKATVAEALLAALRVSSDLAAVSEAAVTAHRRAVLDQRDDGTRLLKPFERAELVEVRDWVTDQPMASGAETARWLLELLDRILAALADAEIARRQAEAERDDQVERATETHVLADQMRRERDAMGRPVWDMLAAAGDGPDDVTARDRERHAANDGTA